MNKLIVAVVAIVILVAGFLLFRDQTSPPADAPRPETPAATASADAVTSASPAAGLAPPDTAPRVFWHAAGGENILWRFGDSDAPATLSVQAAAPGWTPLGFAARGWSGADAVLWRQDADGELRLWRVAGEGEPQSVVLPPAAADWTVAALADVDGDAEADLVWTGARGAVAVWRLQAGAVIEQAVIGDTGGGWRLAAIGDFDADARADLFWRQDGGGLAAVWHLDGLEPPQTRTMADPGAAWRALTAAAIDATPGDDLLWQGESGALVVWGGADPALPLPLARGGLDGWALLAALDTDADGRDELLWHNGATGQVGAWHVSGEGAIEDAALPAVGSEWRAVPAY